MMLIALNGLSFNIFKSLAEEYDLELVFVKNSHEFVHEYMKKTEFVELMRRLGALGDGNQDQSTLSTDEWDAAYLYLSFVLRKRGGESDGGQRRGERRKNGKINLSKDDVLYIDNESVKECNFTQQRVS
ncbi:BnaC05g11070D [Brassica napus]|uniref:mRNA (guanine-N(7))-methyltransferase n=1 Tax=Brassica napus TaxID=3708 RepID=A0A078HTV4_BRANA|nr:BnaC05g11070D [Brassica napus]